MSDDEKTRLRLVEEKMLTRQGADELYAIKLVERIVFGACVLVLVAFATAIIALVVKG